MDEKGSLVINNIKVIAQVYPTLNKVDYQIRIKKIDRPMPLEPRMQSMQNPVLGRGQ